MAFFSKVGNVLKQTVSKQLTADMKATNPSIFQSVRCMSTSKLFIGGLSYSTDEENLRSVCQSYGDVLEARIIMDRETGRSRGFAFVTYNSSEAASAAIQALDGQDLHGRRIRVNYATDRAPRMSPSFGQGGGGFGGGYGSGGGGYGAGGGGYGAGGGGYGTGGGYDHTGGNYGGGGYQSGGYGGGNPGNYNQGGYNNYGNQNSGLDNFGAGGSSGSGDGFSGAGNFGASEGAGGNLPADSGFASSGLGAGSGLGQGGGEQFGSYASSGMNDNAVDPGVPVGGDFKEDLESGFSMDKEDDDKHDEFAKRA